MSGVRWFPVFLATTALALAHDIITTKLTYARDVRPILAQRCLACHGATASIPLTTYEQVRPWAVDIKEQVLSRAMPPWGAVKGFRALNPDESLTEDELTIVAAWVVGGAPEGNEAAAPPNAPALNQAPPPATPTAQLAIDTRGTISTPVTVVGISPRSTAPVRSAKITAHLPDGQVEPLLWLSQYDGSSKRSFHFRDPLSLPAGTIVAADVPLSFALETVKASPQVP